MTDGLDQALANVGLDLLRADADLTVYDGVVPADILTMNPPPPYVLVYVDLTQPDDDLSGANGLDGAFHHRTVAWYCHCVGADAVAARAVGQRVRTALVGAQPAVAGVAPESVGLIREIDSAPAARNETLGRAVLDAVRVFELYVSA